MAVEMTPEDVRKTVLAQAGDEADRVQNHGIRLRQALVSPKRIPVIVRTVDRGRVVDQEEIVWLVAQENNEEGYRIVMREDGRFGLASPGFPSDRNLVLVGWYGSLRAAFIGM